MQMRRLGPSAPSVTAVALGGMPLSMEVNIGDRPDEATSIRVIHGALDAGVTLIDTADVYSFDDSENNHNERLVAKALKTWSGDRDKVTVATKGGLLHPERRKWIACGKPEHLRAACDRSLAALGVDRIDLYQFHCPDPNVPFEDSVGAMAELREKGKVRWVGLSNVSIKQIEAARKIVPIESVQNFIGFYCRDSLRSKFLRPSLVQHCGKHGLGVLAYSPLGGLSLNKKLPDHPVLRPIAERHGCSAHAVVIAWVLAQGPQVIPIVAGRKLEHVLDSISAADVELSPQEVQAIDRAEFDTAP